MDDNLKEIAKFVISDKCIYDMNVLDYPNLLQQQFISNYYWIIDLMENDHSTITKTLFSFTEKSIDSISQGFIYCVLVDPQWL